MWAHHDRAWQADAALMRESLLQQELERARLGGEREKLTGKDLTERLIEMQETHQKEIQARALGAPLLAGEDEDTSLCWQAMEEANMQAFILVEKEEQEKARKAQLPVASMKHG